VFTVSSQWKTDYPGAAVGVLAMRDVANPQACAALDERKAAVEEELRTRFAGADRAALRALPVLQAYHSYYKRFDKSYHVQLQLESLLFKGRAIPHVAALVEAMFMAELKNLLLTAGHDLDVVQPPVTVDVADGSERYVRLDGQEQALKAGDMYIRDGKGILSSIVYGPDGRTRLSAGTAAALFTVYAPPGIAETAVSLHLHDIVSFVRLVAPAATVETLQVHLAR
jgi:DNA/RNA-binding domain of Phe-tRNA-synthetase-like protein